MGKYPKIVRDRVVREILKFLDTLGLMEMRFEVVRVIVDSVWKLLTDGDDILYSDGENFYCLKVTLSILSKALEDNKNPFTYQQMQQKGISTQLIKLIDRIRKLSISL